MKIVFMGTPQFSVPCLNSLITSKHKVDVVITQPDRPKGRGKKLVASPVKEIAIKNNIEVLQPERINKDEEAIALLEKLAPDIAVTAAFGQIISEKILSIPKHGCINVHTSLLPEYRGAAPINRALINGEKKTGISIIKMSKSLDDGDIIDQNEIEILQDENAEELENRLADQAAISLLNVIESFENNTVKYTKQDEAKSTYANKLEKNEGLIDWNSDRESIHNLVRGLIPWPCAFSFLNKSGSDEKKRIIIKKTFINEECNNNGTAYGVINKTSDKGLLVSTKSGSIWVTLLQPEGKRVMEAKDYINGHGIKPGDFFSCE